MLLYFYMFSLNKWKKISLCLSDWLLCVCSRTAAANSLLFTVVCYVYVFFFFSSCCSFVVVPLCVYIRHSPAECIVCLDVCAHCEYKYAIVWFEHLAFNNCAFKITIQHIKAKRRDEKKKRTERTKRTKHEPYWMHMPDSGWCVCVCECVGQKRCTYQLNRCSHSCSFVELWQEKQKIEMRSMSLRQLANYFL